MEEILASIRRIISDEDAPAAAEAADPTSDADTTPEPEAVKMAAELDPEAGMSQDDLDKLFDEDGGGFDVADVAFEAEPEPEPVEEEPAAADDESAGDDDSVLELTEDFAVDPDDLDMVDMEAAMASGDVAFEGAADDDAADSPDESEADAAFAKAAAEAEAAETAARKAEPKHEPVLDPSEYKPIPDHIEPVEDKDPLVSALAGSAVSSLFADLNHTVLSNNAKTLDDLVREMLRPMLKAWLEANLPTVVERMVRQEIERVSRGR